MLIQDALAANGRITVTVQQAICSSEWFVTARAAEGHEFDESDEALFLEVAGMPECIACGDIFDLADFTAGGEAEARRIACTLLVDGGSAHQRLEAAIICSL